MTKNEVYAAVRAICCKQGAKHEKVTVRLIGNHDIVCDKASFVRSALNSWPFDYAKEIVAGDDSSGIFTVAGFSSIVCLYVS